MSPGIDALLEQARAGLHRLTPQQTVEAVRGGALLVDTRTELQRREQGDLPGAVVIDRTVLEWRLDPASAWRIPEATGYDREIVLVCRQGYSSSLAAASLQTLGLRRATDMIGGVDAWLAAGLPTHRPPRRHPPLSLPTLPSSDHPGASVCARSPLDPGNRPAPSWTMAPATTIGARSCRESSPSPVPQGTVKAVRTGRRAG